MLEQVPYPHNCDKEEGQSCNTIVNFITHGHTTPYHGTRLIHSYPSVQSIFAHCGIVLVCQTGLPGQESGIYVLMVRGRS